MMLGVPALPLGVLLLGANAVAALGGIPETLEAINVALVTSSAAGLAFAWSAASDAAWDVSQATNLQVEP